jgi:hypothetical protein
MRSPLSRGIATARCRLTHNTASSPHKRFEDLLVHTAAVLCGVLASSLNRAPVESVMRSLTLPQGILVLQVRNPNESLQVDTRGARHVWRFGQKEDAVPMLSLRPSHTSPCIPRKHSYSTLHLHCGTIGSYHTSQNGPVVSSCRRSQSAPLPSNARARRVSAAATVLEGRSKGSSPPVRRVGVGVPLRMRASSTRTRASLIAKICPRLTHTCQRTVSRQSQRHARRK